MIREKIIIYFRLNETLPTLRQMKIHEEQNKFKAMQNVLLRSGIDLSHTSISPEDVAHSYTSAITLNAQSLIALEYKRALATELYKDTSFSSAWIKLLRNWSVTSDLINEEGEINTHFFDQKILSNAPFLNPEVSPPELNSKLSNPQSSSLELSNALKNLFSHSNEKINPFPERLYTQLRRKSLKIKKITNDLETHIQELNRLLTHLLHTLKDRPNLFQTNPALANRQFLYWFRKLLNHPLYKICKLDSTLPHVSLLHQFANAIWNEVHVIQNYCSLGKAIMVDANIQSKESKRNTKESEEHTIKPFGSLSEKLLDSQSYIAKIHHTNDSITSRLCYAITHFRHVMGSFASEGGFARSISSVFGTEHYDAHGTLSNNPSLQGITQWEGPHLHGTIHNCYGGTPTLGDDQIAPEFLALLQATENNLLFPQENPDFQFPSKIIFNNLQNIDKFHGEGPRSRTLMKLNETYPLAFKGTILAKDSALYLMKSPKDVIWQNAHQFGEQLKEKLLLSIQYDLEHPENSPKKYGFYFFGSSEKWEPIFNVIIEQINLSFPETSTPHSFDERKALQGAYQEYFYALLICVIECKTLHELNACGINNPLVTALTACKENIDRGGMENMKYMYLRLPFTKKKEDALSYSEQLEVLIGVMNSRPLSVRDRGIIKNRMPQTLAFIDKVSPEQFQETLKRVLTQLNLQAKFTYAFHLNGIA